MFVLVRKSNGETGSSLGAVATDDDRWSRCLDRFGEGGALFKLVVRAGKRERTVDRRLPQAGDDGELFFELVESFGYTRKGDPVGEVFFFEPSRTEPELDSTRAESVDLSDADREWSGKSKGR